MAHRQSRPAPFGARLSRTTPTASSYVSPTGRCCKGPRGSMVLATSDGLHLLNAKMQVKHLFPSRHAILNIRHADTALKTQKTAHASHRKPSEELLALELGLIDGTVTNEAAALRLLELFGASLEDALLPALLHSNAGVHRTWSCENAVSTPSAEREEPAADAAAPPAPSAALMRARVARGKRWAASGRQSVGSERASGIEQPVRLSDVDPVLARSARDPSAEEADATVSSVHALTLGSPRVSLGGGGGGWREPSGTFWCGASPRRR